MSERAEIAEEKLEIALKALQFYADANHKSFDGDCIESGQKAQAAIEKIWSLYLEFEKDGNQWRAHKPDFVNLQESHAGFGATIIEAAKNYYEGLE